MARVGAIDRSAWRTDGAPVRRPTRWPRRRLPHARPPHTGSADLIMCDSSSCPPFNHTADPPATCPAPANDSASPARETAPATADPHHWQVRIAAGTRPDHDARYSSRLPGVAHGRSATAPAPMAHAHLRYSSLSSALTSACPVSLPCASVTTVSHSRSSSSRLCELMRKVARSACERMMSRMIFTFGGSIPAVGSSSNTSSGLPISA